MAAVEGYGYDKTALKNYAAMSAMYWPGFDSSAYAANAAYSQANRVLAAVPGSGKQEGGEAGVGTSPQTGASPPSGFGFTQTSPANAQQSFAPPPTSAATTLAFPAQSTTPGMTPKKKAMPVPIHLKDESYWERRRRNNESARRSRESRRMKEDQTHYKLLYLENENLQLRTEISMMRAELERMRLVLGNAQLQNGQFQPPQ